jgi:hypothetical protein
MKRLADNIVRICEERELRNPALVKETLELIGEQRMEMKNVLNVDTAFSEGFKAFLMQIDRVNIKEEEIEDVRQYIAGHLESTVGYWTEEEVVTAAKNWRLEQTLPPPEQQTTWTGATGTMAAEPTEERPTPDVLNQKRDKAKARISRIETLNEAKQLLLMLCNTNSEWLLDQINR